MATRRDQAAPAVRAAIYCRKSVARGLDQEVNSLTVQRAACEEFCRSQGWTVTPTLYNDGGFTGRNTDRPAYQSLMRDAAASKFDRVVVYKLDRLSRSLRDFINTLGELEQAGVAFTSVTQQFDTGSALGRLTLGILASFAGFESDLNSERTRDAIAAAKRGGRFCGGHVPFGYDATDGHLVVNAAEAVVVRELFDFYLQLRGALPVARSLNDRGRITRSGRRWDKAAVLRVLRSPTMAGLVAVGDSLHRGQHEAIIEEATWRRVQEVADDHAVQKRPYGRSTDYLLGGLTRCARCGGAYTPASTTKGRRRYFYVRCATRDRLGRDACTSRPLPAQAVESFVVERIRVALAGEDLAPEVTTRLAERIRQERVVLESDRAKLLAQVATLSGETASLTDRLVEMQGPGARAVESRLDEKTLQLQEAEGALEEVERKLAALDSVHADRAWVAKVLADFATVWEHLTPANRQRLVRALVQEVVIDEPAGTISVTLVDLAADLLQEAS